MLTKCFLWGCTSVLIVLVSGCRTSRAPASGGVAEIGANENGAGQIPRLGRHHRGVTTRSAEAQAAFDRGLTLTYSFAHYAAEKEFQRAAAADPDCAMAWWGVALVNGPHINFPFVPPPKAAAAWAALKKAQSAAVLASPLEKRLIDALAVRYANPQPEDRKHLDEAYAEAMRQVWKDYPQDADVAVLFAESLMDLHPWDLWVKTGEPKEWTPEIVRTLEAALLLNSSHPGANHYYIHAVEASAKPQDALAAADRLGKLVPDSGHMVHMPSHIFARVGKWDSAAESNRRAMQVDGVFRTAYPRPGFYAVYMLHNTHFLTFVAMMQGNRQEALQSARKMTSQIPEEFIRDYTGVVDGYMATAPEVLMRFGMWEEILREPEPRQELPLARALWRFTRAAALTALDRKEEAAGEREAFKAAVAQVPADRTMGNNRASHLLDIATHVLDGEVAARAGRYDEAISSLRKATELEDRLTYDEPPTWIQPVRHTLGAVLLKVNQPVAAERVYREELSRNPGNGWSLMGLRDSLERQGKTADAKLVSKRYKNAWARADVTPPSTCYCQQLTKSD